jgi:hypothetical protein
LAARAHLRPIFRQEWLQPGSQSQHWFDIAT